MGLAEKERAALADLLMEVGPDRPTLCAGWNTGDLLAHLLVRERRPDGAIGLLVPRLSGHSYRVREQIRARPWSEQVALLRSGPPPWNPMGWGPLNELANGAEMTIHHEDARRGAAGWSPREPDPVRDLAVARLVGSTFMRLRLHRSAVGIAAIMPGRERQVLRAGTAMAEVHGEPIEILLWLGGRAQARVTLHGDPQAVRAAESLRLHM